MSIQSPHGILFQPQSGGTITLVAAGGWLAELPVFEAAQGLFEADGIQLAAAFFRPLGNVVVDIQFTTEVDHADLATALDVFLAPDATPGGGSLLEIRGTLIITTGVCQCLNAVLTTVRPELPSGAAATTRRSYHVRTSIPVLT